MFERIDSEAAAWSWLSVGFTLNLVSLLGFDNEVDKTCLLQIQRLYLASLAADESAMALLLDESNGQSR